MKSVGFWRKQDIPPEPPPRKHGRSYSKYLVASALAVAILMNVVATGDNSSGRSPVLSSVDVAKRGSESVLRVFVESTRGKGSGSAIQIADDTIVTNFHVVQRHVDNNWKLYILTENGEKIPLEVVGAFQTEDIAILRAKESLRGDNVIFANSILLGYDPLIPKGSIVYSIGYPGAADRLGGESGSSSFAPGMVSRTFLGWWASPPTDDSDQSETPVIIQHTAPTNPGNSGGALLNICGEVVGINTQREARVVLGPGGIPLVSDPIQGIFFALDAGTITRLLDASDIQYEQSPTRCEPWAE